MIAQGNAVTVRTERKEGTMGRRIRLSGIAGFALVATAALVVVAGGAASANKVTQVGFASPEKPTDYGWNQQGFIGAKKAAALNGATVIDADGRGLRRTQPRRSGVSRSGSRLDHRARVAATTPPRRRSRSELKVPVIVWDAKPERWSRRGSSRTCVTRGAGGRVPRRCARGACSRRRATLGIVVSASDDELVQAGGRLLPGCPLRQQGRQVQVRPDRPGRRTPTPPAASASRSRSSPPALTSSSAWATARRFGMMQAVETAKAPAGARRSGSSTSSATRRKIDKKGVLLSSELWDFAPIYNAGHQGRQRRDVRHGRTSSTPRTASRCSRRTRRRPRPGRRSPPRRRRSPTVRSRSSRRPPSPR